MGESDRDVPDTGSSVALASEPLRAPVTIFLLGDPVAVGRPRFTRAGIAYTPGKTRDNLAALRLAAQLEMGESLPLEGPLRVVALFAVRMPKVSRTRTNAMILGLIKPARRPDLDNLLKALDAFTGVVWRDDAQIVELRAEKRYDKQPKVVITVTQAR